jgi:hypothetical protein
MRIALLRGITAFAIAAGATLSFTTPAHATGNFTWEISETEFPGAPTGALSGVGGSNGWVVEVDQPAGTNNVNYSIGIVQPNYTVSWGQSTFLDTGLDATVAVSGNTVVEEHRDVGSANFSYRTGTIVTHFHASPTISWGPKFYHDNGYVPSLAFVGSTVVEVHQGNHPVRVCNGGDIWYRMGTIQSDGSINWSWGVDETQSSGNIVSNLPSIAATGSNTLIQVETGTNTCGTAYAPLYYLTGTIQSNNTISWGSPTFFDNGWFTHVAAWGNTVAEVHQGGTGNPGPLWYRSGTVGSNGGVSWSGSTEYDTNGSFPFIAGSGDVGVEVHTEGDPPPSPPYPPYYYRTGLFN